MTEPRWEHFEHGADIGVRGFGRDREEAFANAALAMTAVVADPAGVRASTAVDVVCHGDDDELLLVDFLNAVVFEMATRGMLFSAFQLEPADGGVRCRMRGEPVDRSRHAPAVEVKGATMTELRVGPAGEGGWLAQCVVDV